jgi:uncharacterized protein
MNIKILLSAPMAKQNSQFGGCDGDCGVCDGDCACPPMNPSDVDQSYDFDAESSLGPECGFATTVFHRVSRINSLPLQNQEEIIFSQHDNVTLAVINPPARRVLDFFSTPHMLTEWTQQTDISCQEAFDAARLFHRGGFLEKFTAIHTPPDFLASKATTLEAWLFLTRACNLACPHCFVGKDTRRMELETGLKAIQRLFDLAGQDGYRQVKVKYAGGEPTLNWGLVLALHQKGMELHTQTGIQFEEILVTNATALSRSRLQFMQDSNIHLSVSLDGFGDGHDRQRPMVNGGKSFKRVLKSLQLALEMDISPFLTMTLTSLNLSDLPAVTNFAIENNLYLNMNFYRPHQLNDPLAPEHEALIESVLKAFDVIKANPPKYRLIDGLMDRSNFGFGHQHTCGAGLNYLSVDTDGRVLPCHMLTGQNNDELSQLLETVHPAFGAFENPRVDARVGCATCEWRYWCTGGCPILTHTTQGTVNAPSPYCDVYKALYPELLRLESARLLKYGDGSRPM